MITAPFSDSTDDTSQIPDYIHDPYTDIPVSIRDTPNINPLPPKFNPTQNEAAGAPRAPAADVNQGL